MAIINGTFLPDILIGTSNDDTINGFGGLDTISGGDGNDTIDGGNGDDVLTGNAGNDILIGGPGAATLLSVYNGGIGNDLMIASDLGIAEDFDGGDDVDTVSFAARDSGVTVFLSVIGIPLLDTVRNTENVIGSAFDDEITGDSSANEVTGGEGDDILDGLGGNDTAVFTGNRSDYTASHGSGSAIIITDQRSGTTDGEDTTSSFEFFKFADRTYTAAELFAPTLTGVAANTTFGENAINAAAAILDSSVSVTTVEPLTGGTLAVSGLLAEDTVSVQHVGSQAGEIGFAGGNVSYGGVVIGTATGGTGATLTFTFNASATDAAVQALVAHLTYQNTSNQPTAARNLTITLTDGAAGSTSSMIAVNVTTDNDAPSITSNGGGPTASAPIQENATAVTTVAASDPDASPTIVYSIVGGADQAEFQIDASTGALSFIAAPDYEAPTDGGADNSYVVQVRASDGSLNDVQTITVNVTNENEVPPATAGTPSDDAFTAPTGTTTIDALGGVDTVTFDFALVDATFVWSGNTVIITSDHSQTTLTGVEVFVFTDGTANNADGHVLVDDLYYYAQSHDVWLAQVDADLHYSEMGWKEDRDPNAFFDTSLYLALNQDVKAAGIDPLAHYEEMGWTEGRIPSFKFDPQKYLADNPDVVAANVDPLQHLLQFGAGEGREPTAVARLVNADGFDAVCYLTQNPEIAAAGLDPYAHFQQSGWHEGRNPNAFFDTAGYLAQNPDVAAAGIDPLFHYNNWGWHEGRDPSTVFDTADYLSANPDVLAAQVNPLIHFLQLGISEGRLPQTDGLWG
jgi:hypothetical protein